MVEAISTFEELQIILTEIEAILNSWPITSASAEPYVGEASPAHFFIVSSLILDTDEHLEEKSNHHYIDQWQSVSFLKQQILNIFCRDYLL